MTTLLKKYSKSLMTVLSTFILMVSAPSYAQLVGINGGAGPSGPIFNLSASDGYIYTPDGDSVLIWGYADDNAGTAMQYPGPTLIVNQGDLVTINLRNKLNDYVPTLGEKTSLVFPGHDDVVATGGTVGMLTNETLPNNLVAVTYTFTANRPGTFIYHSGTNQELQTEMGLVGTLVVRPTDATGAVIPGQAYASADSQYDYEYLFLLTEMDPQVHYAVERAQNQTDLELINNTEHHSVLWFINGRNGPDTLADDNAPFLPHQPYGSLAQTRPGEQALLRFVNAGRDLHPFHTHGNHFKLIARDGMLLQTPGATTTDLARFDFTLQAVPGATYDALWTWTGTKLGWDVFGDAALDPTTAHQCTSNPAICPDTNGDGFNDTNATIACFDASTREYCPDHGKKFPVQLTDQKELTFGGFYSGSPFFGAFANLPPGEGGLNLFGGMFYMWHSHTEREIVNNDIYPGGMLTMMVVQPYTVTIPK